MYLFKVTCEFTVSRYDSYTMEMVYFRTKKTSLGLRIEEQDKYGVWQSYDCVSRFTEDLANEGYTDIRVTDAVWEKTNY